jgi:predicted NUDIX family NTP pyrophosphohydrolase
MSPRAEVQRPKSRAPVSAGCVITRNGPRGLEVLLVHARGATFKKPLFGIPKGLVEPGESVQATAQRETLEETGLQVQIRAPLGSVQQKSGKIVHAFWAEVASASVADIDERGRCTHPDAENDVCRFYPIDEARELMIEAQRELLDRVRRLIESASPPKR